MTRFAFPRRNSIATYFTQQNVGKRNISLDLKHPAALGLLRRLADGADVVLENFRPGVMSRLGLGYDDLAAPTRGSCSSRSRATARPGPGWTGAPTHRS